MRQVVSEAIDAFRRGAYLEADSLFGECQHKFGAQLFEANREIIKNRIVQQFVDGPVSPEDDPMVYFCVPVMNRLEDIQATLGHNLKALDVFSNVRIIVNLFDEADESYRWILDNFDCYIKSGLLQINRLEPLAFWHFSWAKNSFKDYVGDEGVYSSLDGDNYVTEEEVARTKQVYKEFGPAVIHHFTGKWGDGSSGRVSVPARYYKQYGYRDEIFHRQFDEMSLMMNVLRSEGSAKYVCREEADIFTKSWFLRSFQKKESWAPDKVFVDLGPVKAPENPKGDGYVARDEKLELYTRINANYSLLKLCSTEEAKDFFSKALSKAKDDTLESDSAREIASKAVMPCLDGHVPALSNEPTLYSVVKNDSVFLSKWVEHYRSLGIRRFILVDDGSDKPLVDEGLGSDVFVYRPAVGDFKNFKVFWLMCLMRQFQEVGSLCICVDADEFLEIPEPNLHGDTKIEAFNKNSRSLRAYGRAPGLLLDLMPENEGVVVTQDNYLESMNYHADVGVRGNAAENYKAHPSVRWAFSDFWERSYRHDLRYHAYRTVDCLRKFPIFIYDHDVRLNQGFHDLIRGGSGSKLQSDDALLPIRHYKMLKILVSVGDSRAAGLSNYFGRTAENQSKIYSLGEEGLLGAWRGLEKRRFVGEYIGLRG